MTPRIWDKDEEWVRREEVFTVAFTQLNDNKQALAERRVERERVSRILRNLPMIVHREECLKELADLVRVPDLPLDFAEQRVAIFTAKASAQRRRMHFEVKLSELSSQLESIEIPTGFIERGSPYPGRLQPPRCFPAGRTRNPGGFK